MKRKEIDEIAQIVERACKSKNNYFGYGAWTHHIFSVVKYSKILSKKLGANEEVAELAALLHDYASVKDKSLYPKHHIYSARFADQILTKYNYPDEKIEKVKECILTHRGSKELKARSKEAKILKSADSMAHFDNVESLLYLAYVNHKMDIDEGKKWVLAKLERSWKKLIPEAKVLIKDKYDAIRKALN